MPFIAFLLGTVFGSFANAVAWRLHTRQTLGGRSKCPKCEKTIGPQDLVPILSWAVLRGRCRMCQGRISWHYPFSEIMGGILFVGTALHFQNGSEMNEIFFFQIFFSVLILICVLMDLRWKELPLELMLFGTGATLLVQLALAGRTGTEMISAVFVSLLFFGSQWIVSKRKWIGEGDLFFSAMLTVGLGTWQLALVSIYVTYLVGAVLILLLLFIKRVKRGDKVPFAPFLATGYFMTLWYGEPILTFVRALLS
ncbi:MAG: prepilin peptidase [bacterium]|nr:prepilin peptidase [bacterium]